MNVEEETNRLSFSDLSIEENSSGPIERSPRTTSPRTDQFFEFFATQSDPVHSNTSILFCGKVIHRAEEEAKNESRKRDYFANFRSHSFRRSSATDRRYSRDPCYHAQRVNITALTSMSAKSRRRMFMFGPVKFKPEMELDAIKQRLRRAPAASEPPGKAVVSGGGSGRRLWCVVRSNLRLSWRLTRVLAKSLSCIPMAAPARGGGMTDVGN